MKLNKEVVDLYMVQEILIVIIGVVIAELIIDWIHSLKKNTNK